MEGRNRIAEILNFKGFEETSENSEEFSQRAEQTDKNRENGSEKEPS